MDKIEKWTKLKRLVQMEKKSDKFDDCFTNGDEED